MNKNYEEFAVKNVYYLVKDSKAMKEYLPTSEMDIGKMPDRVFFWGIAFTQLPTWAARYYKEVLKNRMNEKKADPRASKVLNVS